MKNIRSHLSLVIVLFLSSCTIPTNPPPSFSTHTPTFIFTTIPSPACQTTFERRELREPYKHGMNNAARFTLDDTELHAVYQLMGLSELCIPLEAGAPFLNVDWNAETMTAASGRMVSLGFEDTYSGSGWSRIYLVHSTYDFAAGTEYDRFMTGKEWTAYQNSTLEGIERLPDGRGFIRYKAGLGYDTYPIFKTVVFPSELGYTALVLKLGVFDGEFDIEVNRLKDGNLPEDAQKWLPVFETMTASLK